MSQYRCNTISGLGFLVNAKQWREIATMVISNQDRFGFASIQTAQGGDDICVFVFVRSTSIQSRMSMIAPLPPDIADDEKSCEIHQNDVIANHLVEITVQSNISKRFDTQKISFYLINTCLAFGDCISPKELCENYNIKSSFALDEE
jgi:hypothetical protein